MSGRSTRRWLYAALFLVFLLHNDLWLWNDPDTVAGVPVGLAYHVGYCLVVTLLMAMLVRFAWPEDLGSGDGDEGGA